MLIDKYTVHTIFTLPIIFYDILSKNDLKDNDFVNLYTYDLNNNRYNNHIFLVFHNIKPYLEERLKNHQQYIDNYTVCINRVFFKVFVFLRSFTMKYIIDNVNKGLYNTLQYKEKIKILTFWQLNAESIVHQYLFDNTIKTILPICEYISKQDGTKKAPSDLLLEPLLFILYKR